MVWCRFKSGSFSNWTRHLQWRFMRHLYGDAIYLFWRCSYLPTRSVVYRGDVTGEHFIARRHLVTFCWNASQKSDVKIERFYLATRRRRWPPITWQKVKRTFTEIRIMLQKQISVKNKSQMQFPKRAIQWNLGSTDDSRKCYRSSYSNILDLNAKYQLDYLKVVNIKTRYCT